MKTADEFLRSMPASNREGEQGFPPKVPACVEGTTVRINFYREELLKHLHCLEHQREYYSEKAIGDVEAAVARLMSQVGQLCARENGDQLVCRLLRKIDGVTRLSAWSDAKKLH